MKRILITGGFGFIGSHLIEEILEHEPDSFIHVVDNLSSTDINPINFIKSLGDPELLSYDIMDLVVFLQVNTIKYDEVYHLASIVGPAGVLPHAGVIAFSIVADSTTLSKKVLDWNAKIVNISTSEIYGGGRSSEDDDKIVPAKTTVRLEYAVGKLASEISLINLCKSSGLDVRVVRPFNVAGPRQSAMGGFVLPRFIEDATSNKPLTVFNDGKQIRSFTHVKDVANGIRLAMKNGSPGQCYNIGNEDNTTNILDFANRVINLTKSQSEIMHIDPKTIYGRLYQEANDKIPISTKARKLLGWKPNRSIDNIIIDTLEELNV